MLDRRVFKDVDWVLIGLLLANSLVGLVFITSASNFLPGNYALRQSLWILFSLAVLFLLMAIDYKVLMTFSPYFYFGSLAVLAGTLAFARFVAHTKSWITFRAFQIQPSEIMKIALILILARVFSEYKKGYLKSNVALQALFLFFVPFVLVAIQPDLGTAMTFVSILAGAFILAGLRKKAVVIFLVIALGAGFLGWNLGLKDYQKRRLTTLFNPAQDPRGAGYHILQSKIAIGSGGLTGKGLFKGSQSRLRFLPARHTDFIFSVIGEETGFVGTALIMLLYFLFLARMFSAASKARDRAGVYIVFMATLLVSSQFLINVMMIIGLFPITGVPLPLLSYGGSSLVSNFLACGLVINVRMRRFANL